MRMQIMGPTDESAGWHRGAIYTRDLHIVSFVLVGEDVEQ